MLGIAVTPLSRSRDERDINLKLTHRRDIFGGIAIDQFDKDARMIFVEGAQQIEQKTRCQ